MSQSSRTNDFPLSASARSISKGLDESATPFNTSFVYFMISREKDFIYIGSTASRKYDRRGDHKRYGFRDVAHLPGTRREEILIQKYFIEHLQKGEYEGSTSCFSAAAILPYIQWLIDNGFASKEERHAKVLPPRLPFSLWSPDAMTKPLVDNTGQFCLLRTEALESLERDIWETPRYLVDLCREALGGTIDLDPASCAKANLTVEAEFFHTTSSNGLLHRWSLDDGRPSRVFLNPPYGGEESETGAEAFTKKLIAEITEGRVSAAVTILNLQSVPTLWFPRVAEHASAHAIWRKRINFIGPLAKSGKSPAFASSKNGTIISYFGANHELFERTFLPHAQVFGRMKTL